MTVAEFMPSVAVAQHQATVTAALFLVGGLWLTWQRIISWRIPTAVLLTPGFFGRSHLRPGFVSKPRFAVVSWTSGGTVAAASFCH
ncbi:MAG: hypothetical protein CM15mP120_12440 [Pseudomonadota bacterium]|nr:MAG: hypothetical protein CM15mP120_12440 [Pseudomonadota bacterium]